MSKPVTKHDGTTKIVEIPGRGILLAAGDTVPGDGEEGYAPGCMFQRTNVSDGGAVFVNEGTKASCNFDLVSVA